MKKLMLLRNIWHLPLSIEAFSTVNPQIFYMAAKLSAALSNSPYKACVAQKRPCQPVAGTPDIVQYYVTPCAVKNTSWAGTAFAAKSSGVFVLGHPQHPYHSKIMY